MSLAYYIHSGMTETQRLIARIKAAAIQHKLANSTVSARVLGSGKSLEALEQGKTITLAKYERANALLDEMERA